MDKPKFLIEYKENTYSFEYGSQVYIFHTGIYNEIDIKYGMEELLEYVEFVQECYLKDSNRTPLGSLADYIAENWERVKSLSRFDILEEFYIKGDY